MGGNIVKKDIVHTRVVSTTLIVVCIVVSAGLSGFFLDLYKTGSVSANVPPTAVITGAAMQGYPSVPITFDGSGSFDGLKDVDDGDIIAYEWDFGDGYSGIGMRPSHAYTTVGTYSATLDVTDSDGATSSDSVEVIISEDVDGTGMYTLVTVNELLTNTSAWAQKLIRVAYATVTDAGSFESGYGSNPTGWVKFSISDNSTDRDMAIYCQGGADRPLELKQGDLVNISGFLDEYNNNWEINVRVDTLDRVSMCPSIYHLRTLGELFSDRLAHNGELVRVEDALVTNTWAYGWVVTDDTTTDKVDIYAQIGANVSTYVNASDRITIQGVFTYYDYDQDGPDDDEWEIKVRDAAEDLVLRTWEFDYSPTIGTIAIKPLTPSPFTQVTVNATVTDNILVAGASLLYSFNGGTQVLVQMTKTAGSFYEAKIPVAPHGTNVSYFVRATDNKGQQTNSSTRYYVSHDAFPEIIEFGHMPDWVRPGIDVTVWAILEDDGGIGSATVVYSNDSWATTHYVALLDDGVAPDDIAGDMAFNGSIGSFNESTIEYYISVRDSQGQNVTSANNTLISSYDQLPTMGGVYRDTELPRDTDSVKVIANVTDDFMLVNVTLHYNPGTGYVPVNMTLRADGNYEASIPPLPKLSRVSYFVSATDNATHVKTSPSTPATFIVSYGIPTILNAIGHGEYQGGLDYFADVARNNGYYFLEADMNDVDLTWVEFIIISDPQTPYTTDELAVLKAFVENGGGLLLLSSSDYDEGGRPENCNPILQNMGIQGRFNDDGLEDEFNAWDYPTFAESGGSGPYAYIPYFNYYHAYANDSAGWFPPYAAGDYDNWWCFENDTTNITFDFTAQKKWIKSSSVSTLYNTSQDIRVIQGTEYGYNKDNDAGGDAINEAYFYSYPMGGKTFPPVMAANISIGTGRVLYGGFGRTLGDSNYYGWVQSNISEFSANIIDWLVNTPMLPSPEVTDVTATPANPTSAQDVTVSATVTGVGPAISRVVLRYAVNGSYYVSKDMALSAGKYSAKIPKQSAAAVVTYYIQVVDAAGNFGYWPTEPGVSGIGWYVIQGGRNIVLSELAYNPRGTDTDCEFVELYNPLPVAVSLEGWYLQGQDGEDNWTVDGSPFPTGSMIPAFGYFLIGGDKIVSIIGVDASLDFIMPNNLGGYGYGVKLLNPKSEIMDRVAWDDEVLGYLDPNMYESWPYIMPSSDDGSFERRPAPNSLDGNYIDTNNNSADFVYRYFEGPQGSWSVSEYPPWVKDITSPFLLPDDHPKYQVATRSANCPEAIPADADDIIFFGPPAPAASPTHHAVRLPVQWAAASMFQAVTAPGRSWC